MSQELVFGDCLAVLAGLPASSVAACVTDPPYELSQDGKASPNRVFLEMMFPHQPKVVSASAGDIHLPRLIQQILRLRGVGSVPRPSATVPVGAVALDGNMSGRQVDVEDGGVGAIGAPDGQRRNDGDAEKNEHLGDFTLELTDPAALLNALDRVGCSFLSGGLGIGLRIGPSTLPSLLAARGAVDLGDADVRTRYDAAADLVRAFVGATGTPVLRLELGRASLETLTTDGALVLCAVLLAGRAKLIRTETATGRLPSKLESRRVRIVDPITHRALSLNLITHPQIIASSGFMGKAWDGSKIAYDVGVWREVLRVLKPGAYLLAMGSTRTFHRLVCAIEDSGFEIRDTIAWMHGQGFPKSLDVSKALRSTPTCRCRVTQVAREIGAVQPILPTSLIGASVGAESTSVLLDGPSTDDTRGLWLESSPCANGRQREMHSRVERPGGQLDPVMLGASGMARMAEGEQIALSVSGVQVQPESLRDQVVGDQIIDRSAVETPPIPGDDRGGDVGPSTAFVSPRSPAPRGVGISSQSAPVIAGHAGTGTVNPSLEVAAKVDSADGTSEDAITLGFSRHDATERHILAHCDTCGLLREDAIPDGLGTALKPAMELICVARKPLAGTVVQNVLEHGTGALNVDGCRIAGAERPWRERDDRGLQQVYGAGLGGSRAVEPTTAGRWPANVVLSHEVGCREVGTKRVKGSAPASGPTLTGRSTSAARGVFNGVTSTPSYADADGTEAVAAWECVPECAVRLLDEQTGNRAVSGSAKNGRPASGEYPGGFGGFAGKHQGPLYNDVGGASRFFYCPKASRSERRSYNDHPTVKPLALMRWLVRLVTPPGGLVLDPFAGSGTTLLAARAEGFEALGIDNDAHAVEIARGRLLEAS